MKRMKKPALVRERFFPFESSESYGVEDGYRTLHWHKEIEICYIKQGMGKYLINGRDYTFSSGDIFIIGNDDIHLCHDDKELIMQVVMFDPNFLQSGHAASFDYEYLRPFLESSKQFSRKIDSKNAITVQLTALLTQMEAEYITMHNGYNLMIKALLLQFLALVIRHCFTQESTSSEKRISYSATEKIRSIITYLEKNYTYKISLGFLSETFDISVPYLCSTFKSFTGSSPIDYLIRRRILMAKTMLHSTESTIIKISEDCGFDSLSNFNHMFKSLTGLSPTEYRKTTKK